VKALLLVASALAALLGLAHSYLGERYILIRLFRRSDLPHLFGSDWFTRRTLRFAWHLTTIAFWGLAAILTLAAFSSGPGFRGGSLVVVASTFLVSAAVALAATRGRHLSWIVFLLIGILTLLATQ
jgi:hypothetical protein